VKFDLKMRLQAVLRAFMTLCWPFRPQPCALMSHELRTPLNHIIGFTDLVLSRDFGELTAEQEEFLKDVLSSSQHLLSLINDVLDLSKVEAGKMELELSGVRIRDLLGNSLLMVKEKALKQQLRLTLDLDGVPEVLGADERKLKQVIYNLLSNAVKFTPSGGEVRLGAGIQKATQLHDGPLPLDEHEQWLSVRVTDTGIGLESHNLKRIFDPFEQVEGSASRKYQGTGLGLAITRRMVELHAGTIWAESPGIGKGSTFRFVIPARTVPN
jgi:signal transduction histidine kinase